MLNQQPHHAQHTHVECLIPEKEPERPLVRLISNPERMTHEGQFSVELYGVNYRHAEKPKGEKTESPEAFASHHLQQFLAGLKPGEGVDLLYDFGGGNAFHWQIVGAFQSRQPESAIEGALELYRGLSVSLAMAEKHYRFRPGTEKQEADWPLEWCTEVLPAGIRIPIRLDRAIGFTAIADTASSTCNEILVTPSPTELSKTLLSMLIGLHTLESTMRLQISVKPFSLRHDQLQAINRALGWLMNGGSKRINYLKDNEGLNDPALLARVTQRLSSFLKRGCGQRLECRFFSKAPPNPALLQMAAFDLLHGEAFRLPTQSISRQNYKPAEADVNVLDLQSCAADPAILPPLFPSPSMLGEIGVPRFHSTRRYHLFVPGILLGSIERRDGNLPVTFAGADRTRHAYVMGASGTGKSTLLYNMIMQDIAACRGVCVIDPHGDLFRQVLQSIPEDRIDDVAIIDPGDFGHSVAINFLQTSGEYRASQMNFISNEWIRILDRLYDLRQTGGPIFEQYMRNAMLLVMDNEIEGATILDVVRIFENKRFRRTMTSHCTNTLARDFWTEVAESGNGDQSFQNLGLYVTAKLNQFAYNALLRPILGQSQSSIDFRTLMDEGKIVLVNLAKGLLGELDSSLLGMLLIGRIFSSAMSRLTCRQEERRPFYVYIDEFQNFVTDTIAFLLSESRKFNLNLVLANQNLSQLRVNPGRQNVLDAVMANAASVVLFRTGVMDGELLTLLLKPDYEPQDLVDLPEFHAVGRLLVNNRPSLPFVFQTCPPLQSVSEDLSQKIILRSRARYSRATAEVEKDILSRRRMIESGDEELPKNLLIAG